MPTWASRRVGHLLRAPGQLGLGRAYVSGAVKVDVLDAGLTLLDEWSPPPLDRGLRMRLARAAVRAHGLRLPPRRPDAELIPSGRRRGRERDARAVRHHYDVGNDFFALFLDDSMTYSCAFFSRASRSLDEAQEAKLDLVCKKLELREGEAVLDVGCGWGSFAEFATERYGVRVLGITLSESQAEFARRRLGDIAEIRVMDYRDVAVEFPGRFDAIASIGMVEHVGESRIDAYARTLAGALKPGGRLLNHGIARLRVGDPEAGRFRSATCSRTGRRFTCPGPAGDGAGGSGDRHVEGFGADYAVTLRHWLERLEARMDEALRLAGPQRVRVWRLYLRAARRGFERGFISVYQVRARLPR